MILFFTNNNTKKWNTPHTLSLYLSLSFIFTVSGSPSLSLSLSFPLPLPFFCSPLLTNTAPKIFRSLPDFQTFQKNYFFIMFLKVEVKRIEGKKIIICSRECFFLSYFSFFFFFTRDTKLFFPP